MHKHLFLGSLFFLYFQKAALSQCGNDPLSGLVTISTVNQIINSYYAGTGSPLAGSVSLIVGTRDGRGNPALISAGDLVLIIQMQGASINATNNDAYGNGISGSPASGYLSSNLFAGQYEFNTVASVAGTTINFIYPLGHNYYSQTYTATNPIYSYQVIRVPRYYDFTITASGSVTCPPWNGVTGGVIVADASNNFTINGLITAEGKGFRGGGGKNLGGVTAGNSSGSSPLTNTDFRWHSPVTNAANQTGGAKGESICGTPAYVFFTGNTITNTNTTEGYINGSMGRGAPGNGGGGGTDGSTANGSNSGGGGGGNAGAGGNGGSGWSGGAGPSLYPYGGHGGAAFTHRSLQQLIMGGGGGAGTSNNGTAATEYQSSGGAGGGIIFLKARNFISTIPGGAIINAKGSAAPGVLIGGPDAAGGGGAGGTIVAITRSGGNPSGLSNVTATVVGGNGGNAETYYDHGPGGGGGGGFIVTNGAFSAVVIQGGAYGYTRTGNATGPVNNTYGASLGASGESIVLASVPNPPCGVLPVSLISFSASVDQSAVRLNWDVAHAAEFSEFAVEYSTDGERFSTLGTVMYSSQQSQYSYSHTPAIAAVYYYRLKLVDNNGHFNYSTILVIKPSVNLNNMILYPQPASKQITMSLHSSRAQPGTISIISLSGNKVFGTIHYFNKGKNTVNINQIEHLPVGIYFVQVMAGDQLLRSKLEILR